jgi:hypothetical protein
MVAVVILRCAYNPDQLFGYLQMRNVSLDREIFSDRKEYGGRIRWNRLYRVGLTCRE